MKYQKVKENRFLIYAPQTQAGKRFPWAEFLNTTKLRKGPFFTLFRYEDFLKAVADVYDSKGSILTDKEVFLCVEQVYFPAFKMHYLQEGLFEDENIGRGEGKDNQPEIIGYFYDKSQGVDREKQKGLRTALKVFSKDLYGDPHAWFSDFEEYFQKQRKEQ